MSGFMFAGGTILMTEVTAGAWMLIQAGLLLAVAGQAMLHLRQARVVARLLPSLPRGRARCDLVASRAATGVDGRFGAGRSEGLLPVRLRRRPVY
jgi:hypothetical protein